MVQLLTDGYISYFMKGLIPFEATFPLSQCSASEREICTPVTSRWHYAICVSFVADINVTLRGIIDSAGYCAAW
jgi:hypothetical protein